MYTQTWLNFQALWDLSMDHVCARVGTDLELWMQLLFEIKNERTTFDTSETQKVFGPISVDFGKVGRTLQLKPFSICVWFVSNILKIDESSNEDLLEFST